MRKTDSKKLLSSLLVLCMLFSLIPFSTFADGEDAGQGNPKVTYSVTATGAKGQYTLGSEYEVTSDVEGRYIYTITPDTTAIELEPQDGYTLAEPFAPVITVAGAAAPAGFTVTPNKAKDTATLSIAKGTTIDATIDYTTKTPVINIEGVFEPSRPTLGGVTISGTAQVGETLTAVLDPEDATVNYQWYRGATEEDDAFKPISGATQKTYKLVKDDEHQYIFVAVTGTGDYEDQDDASTTVYVAAEDEQLVVDGATISGEAKLGETLTVVARANGSEIPADDERVYYMWQICETSDGMYLDLPSDYGPTYTISELNENWLGQYIRVAVYADEEIEDNIYTGSFTTDPVGPIKNEEGNIVIDGVEIDVDEIEATEESFEATAGKVTGANQAAVEKAVAASKVEVTEKMAEVMQAKGFEILTTIMRTPGRLQTLLEGAGLAGAKVTSLEAKTEIIPEPQSCSATQYVLDITPWIKVYATIEGVDEAKELPGAATEYTDDIPEGVPVTIGVPAVLIGNVNNKTIYVTHEGEARQTFDFDPATEKTVTITVPHFSNFTVATTTGGGGGGGYSGGGGGGSSSSSSTTINVGSTSNGTVTVSPKNAKKGDTVTITAKPNSGYVVGTVTVTDKNGNPVSVTMNADGTCSFVMPEATPVTVKVEFVKETPTTTPTVNNPFYDVPSGAYYYDAVLWAIENNITAGMTATSFGPNEPCTRAQIVTFLWRAAGSPRATGSNPFTDISASEYYYDAVLWAVANGITAGTTFTTFSPTETCTRAQAVSFLYRANNSPATSGTNSFTDLASGAYYTSAVQWAVNAGVTAGTTNTTFSPDQNCTRAQIVSFLYRDRVG